MHNADEAISSDLTAPHADTARRARRIAGLRGNSLGISLMLIAEYLMRVWSLRSLPPGWRGLP